MAARSELTFSLALSVPCAMMRARGVATRALIGFAVLFLLAGCGCGDCCEDKLPNRGHATTAADLAQVVQHEARFECWSQMYDLFSARTREKHARLSFRIGISSITVPAPFDYRVVDVA